MLKVFRTGYKREIEVDDLFDPLDEHQSQKLGDTFQRRWEKELERAQKRKKEPSLLRVIAKTFGGPFMLYGLIRGLDEIFVRMAQPVMLGYLLNYFAHDGTVSKESALWYAGGVLLCSMINTFVSHPYMMGMFHLGFKIRIGCCSLMYRKALKLSKAALAGTTVGQITNLMSNDVQRFDIMLLFLHYIWIGPVQSAIVMYYLGSELGAAGLGGFLVLLVVIPCQGYLGKMSSVYRLRTAVLTDDRVRLMNEIISGIQVIKMYTWEKPFADMVARARTKEMAVIRKMSYVHSIIPSFYICVTRLAIFLTVLTYVLTGSSITAQKVFVVTGYYNILKDTMNNAFPLAIAFWSEGWVSVKRVRQFLMCEELPTLPSGSTEPKPPKDVMQNGTLDQQAPGEEQFLMHEELPTIPSRSTEPKPAKDVQSNTLDKPVPGDEVVVKFHGLTAKWNQGSDDNTLSNINLTVKKGQLVAVIGPVGSGKSSLLHAILGEIPVVNNGGTLSFNGRLAYSSQEPWLFSGSIRQNILFGEPYNAKRYHRIVRACALAHDFEQLPHGDRTLVGDRGVILSGGQKARVNLARTVYKDADIYLLDDPLSAVDSHVGKHLFEDCITGLLVEKTVILVTHQLQYLMDADHIVILSNGEIAAQGTYTKLLSSGLDFAQLLGHQENEDTTADESGNLGVRQRKKTLSISSSESISAAKEEKTFDAVHEEEELRYSGHVRADVYSRYAAALGNCCMLFIVVLLLILSPVVSMAGDLWIAQWTNSEELERFSILTNDTTSDHGWWYGLEDSMYIDIYTGLIVATVVAAISQLLVFFHACMHASIQLHNKMFESITRATMKFFNTNPSGRILNRFSKDMGAIDEALPMIMFDCFAILLELLTITVMVAILNFWLLIPSLFIAIFFTLLRMVFLATSRSIKRLEGVTRSPVFSHLNASLQGLTTIRAMGAQSILCKEFDHHQDMNTSAFYLFLTSNRSFGFWLDFGCLVYLGFVIFSFLLLSEDSFPGNVGLAITQTIGLTGMFQWGMRQSAELENQMTAVERVLEYTEVEREPPLQSDPDKKPPKDWPSKGKVEFEKVYLTYAKDDPYVLKGVTFTVRPMEKIGIVGRTGTGKSSLITALFRLVEVEGTIRIDEIDIKTLGLHDLRGKLSIIPQQPVLFSGTLRKNLDPFDEFPDSVLWQALKEVELKDAVEDQPAGLNWKTSEGGSNFSVGQRQLVCLARAIVRNNKILVLDEATANVDPQTDALIQKTIRRKFANCTVLTIAHRLHTVMDNDRLLVIDGGMVVEYDHPYILLQNRDGVLRSLVEETGRTMADELCAIAKENYKKMQHQKTS
ncbi:ATP-binding cassette subfamily C member 4 isoform X2 [Anabrus simplex]